MAGPGQNAAFGNQAGGMGYDLAQVIREIGGKVDEGDDAGIADGAG